MGSLRYKGQTPVRSSKETDMTQPHSDKRSVSTDALDTLGTIHTKEEKRDAIHLAVEQATCGRHVLYPGQHIVLDEAKVAVKVGTGEGLFIVDPFLKSALAPGDKFWAVMYPRQVHSLRHVWSHPAVPE